MKLIFLQKIPLLTVCCLAACHHPQAPSKARILELDLRRGTLISCGPAEMEFGTIKFEISGNRKAKEAFVLGLKMLHSFEYEEAEKVFAAIIDESPDCAMAYWGIAMSNFHPLWAPPSKTELIKGSKAIDIAKSLETASPQENAYISASATFYKDADKLDHRKRCLNYEKAWEQVHNTYPSDQEAAIFYALALNAAADPTDKSYQKQKRAGAILQSLAGGYPNHPGITHYLIHAYDVPGLAQLALPAARKYAAIAPSSAHALHMPSHIFTRLGLWDEDIQSNLASVSSAQCYAQQTGLAHWDEEMHGLDYLVYALLQKGDNQKVKQQLEYVNNIKEVKPANFKVAYAFATIPSRYVIENKLWEQAADLGFHKANFKWEDFIWQKAIVHFARLLGNIHTNRQEAAEDELKHLMIIHDSLITQKDAYKATQVQVQAMAGEAWILFRSGKKQTALKMMKDAADLEDKTEKHPVSPCEVIPARELLGEMQMELRDYAGALQSYEQNLQKNPNRFNGLFNAAQAAEKAGNSSKAKDYFKQLISIAVPDSDRKELIIAKNKIL